LQIYEKRDAGQVSIHFAFFSRVDTRRANVCYLIALVKKRFWPPAEVLLQLRHPEIDGSRTHGTDKSAPENILSQKYPRVRAPSATVNREKA